MLFPPSGKWIKESIQVSKKFWRGLIYLDCLSWEGGGKMVSVRHVQVFQSSVSERLDTAGAHTPQTNHNPNLIPIFAVSGP
jgi:hypothetical protein